jgi:hypothetical protein
VIVRDSGVSQGSIQRTEAATGSKTVTATSGVSAVSDTAGTGSSGLGGDRPKSKSERP